ncbi:MAG: FliA/WhiG family RNA polymerase sigma factor [Gaiellaceae bacterium]|jgi:RNA polymerase sigma factor for flagellar operon FliA
MNVVASGQRLSASEAEALWRAWKKQRDGAARDRLVLSYTPMVTYLASRKVRELPSHCELDDLASCGLVALIEAVDRFDPEKGATFEQYAWTRVSGAIMDELRRQDWASRSVRHFGRQLDSARESFFIQNGRTPSEAELAEALHLTLKDVRKQLEELERADLCSLNAPARVGDSAELLEIGDTVEASVARYEPELATLAGERAAIVREAIASLSARERTVLELVHVEELQGAEIGARLGVSESRVSQILAGARQKLRSRITAYDIDDSIAA